jgi:putative phage-type endonuclease
MSDMIEQGTYAWLLARLGKVTASRVSDVCARTKSGWGASRGNYMTQLILERINGEPVESYENDAMRWGKEIEPKARVAYEFFRDVGVAQVGFVDHPKIKGAGCSPDGLVGDDGLVEIKSPFESKNHLETLLAGKHPSKYLLQMQWQMACTGRTYCDYVSFDPRFPPAMQMFVQRVERDDKLIADTEKNVREFLQETDDKEWSLRTAYELNATLKEAAE